MKQMGDKWRGEGKVRLIATDEMAGLKKPKISKPPWLRVRLETGEAALNVRRLVKQNRIHTVCEEASCPNLGHCYSSGTASFMIMGDICTRRCAFCNVNYGRPFPLDLDEPKNLADAVKKMNLRYVVITSTDRDDLRDGGAEHFVNCIDAIKQTSPDTKVEILTPDFRGRMDKALAILAKGTLPDVFNHNMETIQRLYKTIRPGADYQHSLTLLKRFGEETGVTTKSGIMVGLGEEDSEINGLMQDLRAHSVDLITIGQYLQPSAHHVPVARYVHPDRFQAWAVEAKAMGFENVASGPLVRSSYHADIQAHGGEVH